MPWIRKDAPPAAAADLRASVSAATLAIAEMASELEELAVAIPTLVSDPQRLAQAQDREIELQTLLASKRRTIATIEAAIPAARQREQAVAIHTEADALQRATLRLKRGLPEKYDALARAMADLLKEVQANDRAWARLRTMAGDFGVTLRGESAADALYREDAGDTRYFGSPTTSNVIVQWDGRGILFRGDMVRQ